MTECSKTQIRLTRHNYNIFIFLCRCKTDDEVPHCDARLMAKITGPQYCGMIADITGPFAECLAVLRELPGLEHRAAKLLEFCQFDVCETWNNPAEVERQKCAAIAAFKMECESYGIGWIDFRSSEFCPSEFSILTL